VAGALVQLSLPEGEVIEWLLPRLLKKLGPFYLQVKLT